MKVRMLKSSIYGGIAAFILAFQPGTAISQNTIPYCPTIDSVYWYSRPGTGVLNLTSNTESFIAITKLFGTPDGSLYEYNFRPINIAISGNQISFDAPGVLIFNPGPPPVAGSLGILPAGTYTVTIRPVATNVTPNVACPVLTVSLLVNPAYEPVSVPGPSSRWLGLLAALAGTLGIGALWRRQHRLHPPSLDPKFGGTCP